ncbi:MAG: hypothetical protein WA061_03040 [Microgenomates group bacterium]
MFDYMKRMAHFLKRIFIVLIVFLTVLTVFGYFISKDRPRIKTDPTLESRGKIYKRLTELNNSKVPQDKLRANIYRFMTCSFVGEACTNNPDDGDKNFTKSILGMGSSLIAYPFMNPPASGAYWVTNTLQNAGLIAPSYAAEGIGFASIKPIMGLWKVFRDISYMLLVLFLIAIGFMIMFRVKINPQTIISVENSLPKLAVVMILITFSFAISGFLIDLMYLLIALFISALGSVENVKNFDVKQLQNIYLSADPGTIYDALMGDVTNKGWHIPLDLSNPLTLTGVAPVVNILLTVIFRPLAVLYGFGWQFRGVLGSGLASIVDMIVGIVFAWFTPGIASNIALAFGLEDLFTAFQDIAGATFSIGKLTNLVTGPALRLPFTIVIFLIGFFFLPPLIIGIFFIFTIFYVWARVFMALFTAYIQIILLIIFSPFFILLELIPGSKLTFSQWLKNLAGELIAFPTVVVVFTLSYIIGQMGQAAGMSSPAFFSPPFVAKADVNTFGTLISFGLAFLIPDFIKSMKEAIGAKGLGVNAGIGLFFGGAEAGVGGVMGGVGTFSSVKLAAPGMISNIINKVGGKNAGAINDMLNPSGTPQKPQGPGH